MNGVKEMHLDRLDRNRLGASLCLYECHQGGALAHLLPGDKGGEDVHLLLLAAKHLGGQPLEGNLIPDCTLIGPMKMLLWAVMMVPVPPQPRLNIIVELLKPFPTTNNNLISSMAMA